MRFVIFEEEEEENNSELKLISFSKRKEKKNITTWVIDQYSSWMLRNPNNYFPSETFISWWNQNFIKKKHKKDRNTKLKVKFWIYFQKRKGQILKNIRSGFKLWKFPGFVTLTGKGKFRQEMGWAGREKKREKKKMSCKQ